MGLDRVGDVDRLAIAIGQLQIRRHQIGISEVSNPGLDLRDEIQGSHIDVPAV
jgi:hypothetical protein